MSRPSRTPLGVALTLPLALPLALSSSARAEQFDAVVITKTDGYHHTAIHEAVAGLRLLAQKHYFTLAWHEEMSRVMSDEKLAAYDVVIFALTVGDILNDEQQAAMERFIRSGKGFVGVHSAADTEHRWEWYTKLVGHMFHIHPLIQTARVRVLEPGFPGLERFPKELWWTDEWYEFGPARTQGLTYLLTVDEATYDPKADWGSQGRSGKGMGRFHPIAWRHEFEGGRAFYTSLGHLGGAYSDPMFMEHLYGGLYWAATGKGVPASAKPPKAPAAPAKTSATDSPAAR
jgi:uncharacterized protein